jgi:hypothetical protein
MYRDNEMVFRLFTLFRVTDLTPRPIGNHAGAFSAYGKHPEAKEKRIS